MGAEVLGPAIIGLLSAGAQVYEGRRVERKQDNQLAESIRNRGRKQAEADKRVNEELATLEASRSDDARRERLAQYLTTLQQGKRVQQGGMMPAIGSAAFQSDMAASREAGDAMARDTAGLEARIDAPGMQRQQEGFGFGRLATDINRIQREDRGNAYIDELRLRAIRRNPWLDAAAKVGMGYAGSALGAAASGGSAAAGAGMTPVQYGGSAIYSPGSYVRV